MINILRLIVIGISCVSLAIFSLRLLYCRKLYIDFKKKMNINLFQHQKLEYLMRQREFDEFIASKIFLSTLVILLSLTLILTLWHF